MNDLICHVKNEWIKEIKEEVDSMKSNQVYELVGLSKREQMIKISYVNAIISPMLLG